MTPLQRRLYRFLVRLHPAQFRQDFGRDMQLDFEDASTQTAFATAFLDALLSLGRQWAESAVSGGASRNTLQKASLLTGQYVIVSDESLSPIELGRGLLAALTLVALLVAAQRSGSARPANLPRDYSTANQAEPSGDETNDNPEDISTGSGKSAASLRKLVSSRFSPSPHHASAPAAFFPSMPASYSQAPQPTAAGKKQFEKFDVASVRENRSDTPAGQVSMNFPLNREGYANTGGVFRVSNFAISGYLMFAYNLTPSQSSALQKQLPDWANSARFDIDARVEGEPAKDDMRTMVRALLADRFKLVLHAETKEIAVFDMVLAKPGKTGPALTPHPADDPKCLLKAPEGFFSPCGAVGFMPGAPVKVAGRNIPLQMFADNLNGPAGRPVVDKTGLTGTYDVTLTFAADPDPGAPPPPEPTPPSFSQAMGDQAGLKLVPGKGKVVVYLLDQIEHPTPN